MVIGASTGRVGTIDAARSAFTSCVSFAGLRLRITGTGTWTLDVTRSAAGTSTITVGSVRAHVVATAGPTCAWDLAAPTGSFTSPTTAAAPGALVGTYSNSAGSLSPATDPGSLGMWNVAGGGGNTCCVARTVWSRGDRSTWSTTWTLSADAAANNPVAID